MRTMENDAKQLARRIETALDAIERANRDLLALLPEPRRRERLLAEARAIERRWPDVTKRPPLFGTPVGIKDVLHVDGIPTRAGSALPPEALRGAEAGIVRRLRDCGALILGKTVTAEFAYADPGPTCNPHNPAHTPGGSSSGSAALVGARLLPLAIGTQTVGSVIRPAAYCGVVGFKPSYERLPLDGVLCVARSIDTLGLFARDVTSTREAARALLDKWRDAADGDAGATGVTRLLVPDGAFMAQVEPDAAARFESAVNRLRATGIAIETTSIFPDLADIAQRHVRLVQREFADEHTERFAQWGALYRPSSAHAARVGRAVPDGVYAESIASTRQLRARLDNALAVHHANAWLCPATTGPAPQGLHATGNPVMNMPFSHAGVPAITIPFDRVPTPGGALPLGLQLAGTFGQDEALLALAAQVEARLREVS